MVALNRAVAIGFADGFDAGLAALDEIDDERIPQPHLKPAARAEMLLRSGRNDAAAVEFGRALSLVTSEIERARLQRRRLLARRGAATT